MGLKSVIQTLGQLEDVASDVASPSLDKLVLKSKDLVQWIVSHDDAAIKALILALVGAAKSAGFFD